jgi:hypothetical protein
MSILDQIEVLRAAGKLTLLQPIGPRARFVPVAQWRELYVTTDLSKYFSTPQSLGFYADLNVYILGQNINIALSLDHFDCRMARLDPAREDVWEMRYYEHDPQLRLFGRFATTDVFVALLGPARRKDIRKNGFDPLKEQCLNEWRRFFGWTSPEFLGSNDEHEYISKNVHLIGHA